MADDYASQIQSLIAPMQGMAQRLNPQRPVLGEGGLFSRLPGQGLLSHIPFIGQGLSDRLSGMGSTIDNHLDNALLSAAMVPEPRGPEGVGGGISRALQGVLGANQFRRQNALQAMMLPYQMLQPRLQAEDTLAQITQRGQLAKHYASQDAFYDARADHMAKQDELNEKRANASKAVGAPYASDQGIMHQDIMDPVTGKVSQQALGNQAPTEPQTFKNRERESRGASGGFLGELVRGAYGRGSGPGGEYTTEDYGKMADSFSALSSGVAGNKKRSETNVTDPLAEQKDFLGNESKRLYDTIQPPSKDMVDFMMKNPTYKGDPSAGYAKEVQDYRAAKGQASSDFAEYQASGAYKNKVGFQAWRKNRTATGTALPF